MSRALIPATIIASNICEDIGDSNETKHFRILKKVGQAYKKLHLYVSPDISVQSCIVPADHQVELPCDFIFATKVAISRNGKWCTLDLNKNLRPNNLILPDSQVEAECNGLLDGSIDPTLFTPFYNVFRGSTFVGEIYGMGSGYHSNNWYNIENGVLEIGSMVLGIADEVCIEYKSSGENDMYQLIPSEWELAIVAKAKSLYYSDRETGKSEAFEAEFREEYQRLKRLYSQRNPDFLAFLMHSSDRGTLGYPV